MVDLVATPAVKDLPVTIGGVTLELCPETTITWVAALPRQAGRVDAALRATCGIGLPAPDRISSEGEVRAIWTGADEALVMGAAPKLVGAVTTDLSDGVAILRICGGAAREVLMRLVPQDVRDASFPVGASARTMLGHIVVSLVRSDEDTFEIVVGRSMTRSAVRDLSRAMEQVAGQGFAAR